MTFSHYAMNSITSGNISRLCSLIDSAGHITVTAHMKPDGDAAGSSYALMRFLGAAGKKACIVFPDRIPESLAFIIDPEDRGKIISAADDIASATQAVASSDLIFCLDFNRFSESRCGKMADILSGSGAMKVLIDHHLSPETERFGLIFSETEISSTSELLFWILMDMPQTGGNAAMLPPPARKALLAGMTTDTNNFGNSVFPSTLKMASALLEAGTDRDDILYHLYNEYGENRVRLLGRLLYHDMKITGDGVAYMILDRKTLSEFDIHEGDTEGFVNRPLEIGKVRMSCLLKEDDGFFRVSLRSKRGISANRCAMEYFHGGGHELAAGGRLYMPGDIASPEEAAGYVEKATHEFMTAGNE